jgi:hypothetical protein
LLPGAAIKLGVIEDHFRQLVLVQPRPSGFGEGFSDLHDTGVH